MSHHRSSATSLCVTSGIEPLVTELHEKVDIRRTPPASPRRERLERFIQAKFHRAYGAQVEAFCPHLLGFFSGGQRLRAVVGYRDGAVKPLFSEHYLDISVERLMSRYLGQPVRREHLVEVGNLALSRPGHARWVIAATTAYLHAAGYRWVVFTAVQPLVNAFSRLGLRPLPLADADPARLPDHGAAWGRYYDGGPQVYAGDIEAGLAKLMVYPLLRQSPLRAVIDAATRLGAQAGRDAPQGARDAIAGTPS